MSKWQLAVTAATLGAALLGAGCRQQLAVEVVPRGQSEVFLAGGEASLVAPLFLGRKGKAGLCFEIPPGQDTSNWQGRISFDGAKSEWQTPALRLGPLLCFGAGLPPSFEKFSARQRFELCAEVRDELQAKTWVTPCVQAFFEPDLRPSRELEAAKQALLAGAYQRDTAGLVADLDLLATRAEAERLPLAAVQIRLIAAHFLMRAGGAEQLAEVAERLERLPGWLESPVAGYFGAVAEHQAGRFATEAGAEQAGWERISRADARLVRLGLPRLATTLDLAKGLARAGALEEARRRVEGALDECAALASCSGDLLALARADLAWLILQDGAAGPAELARAEQLLSELLKGTGTDPLNRATAQLTLAYRQLLDGRDPAAAIDAAQQLLAGAEGSARQLYYRQWLELLGALAALARGDLAGALGDCRSLTREALPEVKAWAWGCVGRAERGRGRPAAALAAFEDAVAAHELAATLARPEEVLPLGLDQRADAFGQAARAALEAGDPARAWRLLGRLDALSAAEVDRRRCRDKAEEPALRRQWQQLEAEIRASLLLLRQLEEPAPTRERAARERMAADLKARIQEWWWQWPGCRRQAAGPVEADGLDYRAFALDDEVILLGRSAGAIRVLRRTPWRRRELGARLRELEAAASGELAGGERPGERWQRLAAPLAAALVPPEEPSPAGGLRIFGLHGLLQAAPLAALPLPGDAALTYGSQVAVAVAPAGAPPHSLATAPPGRSAPLFVLDPAGNLAGALEWNAEQQRLFPGGRSLRGRDATRAAFAAALPRASLLHLDSHATYDAAFPELSALELADAPLRWVELAELSFELELANLSGCQTGRWPISADRGSFGLGGALVRLGVPWVIASRQKLPDGVAADFNRGFYRLLAEGRPIGESWRLALAGLAEKHPPATWSGLLLLVRPHLDGDGQSFASENR